MNKLSRWFRSVVGACIAVAGLAGIAAAGAAPASAASSQTLTLRVLLIGSGSSDPTTGAWEAALSGEGVPYTEVDGAGSYGAETVALPPLSSGTTGNFNGVVIADSPTAFASGQLSAVFSYESSFGVRQVDGYMYPDPALGATDATAGDLGGTTDQLTAAGLSALPELQGPVPTDTGTYGYPATAVSGSPFTAWLANSSGQILAGVYQHPSTGDPQAGVSELSLFFDYNQNFLQWLILSPGLVNWVTENTHLGLYRNYFGQDIDDNFINDNEWSSQLQCTPGATDPPDYTCPPADQGVTPPTTGTVNGVPANVQMSAADVAYVVNWEKQTGITLNLAFNGIGACTADTAADESAANCTGSYTDPSGTTYADPGQVVDGSYPNDAGLVNALLADQADFNWIIHTWSHLFLGCVVWQPQALTSVVANSTGGTFSAGSYGYEITAATAYGESEPSLPHSVSVGADGSVTLRWPEATNGQGTGGTPGPTLAQEEANHTGGTGFWGYNVYRENPGSTTYGYVGQVAENPAATASTTYSFTDTGATPGAEPDSSDSYPTATNPGIDCAPGTGANSSWLPASSTAADDSIDAEIGLDQAFAKANGLTNYTPAAVVTGEHSGIESPNMPGALADTGVTTVAADASRQPTQYTIGSALTAPRYPSNIYYNASNWPDELNEYNTLYVAQGDSLDNSQFPSEVGHCADTSATTCIAAPATEATLLASESHIMLSHVLDNNPRVGYAHQSDLIGPATENGEDYGYTILDLIDNMMSQYNSWYNATAPLDQMTDVTEAQILAEQAAWSAASAGTSFSATETNGTVTVANAGPAVNIPVTVPSGTTVNGAAFGTPYGGELSAWVNLGTGGSTTLNENVAPTITSVASATSIVGAAFSFTVTTTGEPAPALTESGTLPSGITFTNNGNGTATLSGTAAAGTGGSYPIAITATNATAPAATQSFTLTNEQAPTITSPSTASFTVGLAGTYTVTTTGYPTPTVTETGALPGGLTFHPATATASATISGTPASGTAGTYPVTLSATNASGSTATLSLTVTVNTEGPPAITSGATAFFTLSTAGSFAVTTTGTPTPAISESGALPAGLTFKDQGNGTALLSGTPSATGTTSITVTASNGVSPNATQALSIVVGKAPAFTSGNAATANVGTAFTFTVTASGYPAPALGATGLPPGLSFKDNGAGTGTISGVPTSTGSYPVSLTAVNGTGTATQTLTITVANGLPVITSANSASGKVGSAFSFTFKATGTPTPTLSETGAVPAGLRFAATTAGSATVSGTPTAAGAFPLTISAKNSVGVATQAFTVTVQQAPSLSAVGAGAGTVGRSYSVTVTATGYPAPTLTESGTVPGLTFKNNGNGTGTLSGTPTRIGSYSVKVTATNAAGSASETFVLLVT